MHIAILNTNIDGSDFAKSWPNDAEKFSTLIREVRPNWNFTTYDLTQSQQPNILTEYDGYLITGSPASVNSNSDWVERALVLVKKLLEENIPIFGACFGHQLIAKAMGVEVINNPNGWVLGTVTTHLVHLPSWLDQSAQKTPSWKMYAAHAEQVAELPTGTTLMSQNDDCSIGGFYKESLLTTQYHPEMKPEFIAALIEELESKIDKSVFDRANNSIAQKSDRALFASWIVEFYESSINN